MKRRHFLWLLGLFFAPSLPAKASDTGGGKTLLRAWAAPDATIVGVLETNSPPYVERAMQDIYGQSWLAIQYRGRIAWLRAEDVADL